MKIDVRGNRLLNSPAVRDHAKRRLHFALGRFQNKVGSVMIRFSDPNGPKGGKDKCCKVEAHLRGLPSLFIEETAGDLYAAIDLAIERLGHAIRRELEKHKDSHRHASPMFGWNNLKG